MGLEAQLLGLAVRRLDFGLGFASQGRVLGVALSALGRVYCGLVSITV